MSVKKDRKDSIRAWQIPRCDYWILPAEPNPDDTGDRVRGTGCGLRATHRVIYHNRCSQLTEHACQAHIGTVLDRAARYRMWAQRDGHDIPEPTVVELDFVADTHAAAYGRTRFLRIERVVTGAITQTLIPSQLPIPPPPPRRRRADQAPAAPPETGSRQEELF